jgi:ABC-type uncharacterized transport system fused permease/ATPase subunit
MKVANRFRKLLKISGFTDRLTTLYKAIDMTELTAEKSEFLTSDSISFEDVSIYTPGDQLLAKHLTFAVDHVSLRNLELTSKGIQHDHYWTQWKWKE